MNFTGHVKAVVVVFDGPTRPAEGAAVRVEEVVDTPPLVPTWGETLKNLVGTIDGPADMAKNHGHYIHGAPKK